MLCPEAFLNFSVRAYLSVLMSPNIGISIRLLAYLNRLIPSGFFFRVRMPKLDGQ